jgi:hypothetical protein
MLFNCTKSAPRFNLPGTAPILGPDGGRVRYTLWELYDDKYHTFIYIER